ncbi:hypothetical protein JXA85_02970 [Candidatus Woesearchaeota archaeon]|nr:hypothetical protein [Candidatus Woesearchaeota archaeon]
MRNLVYKDVEVSRTRQLQALKPLRYFALSMLSILLSMFFTVVEWQFLSIALITGLKWIADSRNERINIILEERRW